MIARRCPLTFFFVLCLVLAAGSGCSPAAAGATATVPFFPGPMDAVSPATIRESTIPATPSPSSSPTLKPTPTSIFQPTSTLPPLLPGNLPVLAPGNVEQVSSIGRLGKGQVFGIHPPKDDKTVLVATNLGFYHYDPQSFAEIQSVKIRASGDDAGCLSPDGSLFALGSLGRPITVWRTSDGALLRTIYSRSVGYDWVKSMAISSDDAYLAIGASLSGQIEIWGISDGILRHAFDAKKGVYSLAFSPDGGYLAATSYQAVNVWRLSDEKLLYQLEGPDVGDENAVFSPDGTTLASSTAEGQVTVWRTSDGALLHTFGENAEKGIYSPIGLAFSPDGLFLAAGSFEGMLRLWRIDDGMCIWAQKSGVYGANVVAFAPDRKTVVTGSPDGNVDFWRVSDGKLLRTLDGFGSKVESTTISSDGVLLASGYLSTIYLWRISDGALLHVLKGHTGYVDALSFSPDGSFLISGSWDNTMRLWRTSDGALLRTFSAEVFSVAFSPDGETIAVGTDGKVILQKASDGSFLRAIDSKREGSNFIYSIAFSPDGSMIACGGMEFIVVARLPDGTVVRKVDGTYFYSVAFSPDGKWMAANYGKNGVRLWRVSDGSELTTMYSAQVDVVRRIAFSPDGNLLASGSYNGVIQFWHVSNGRLLKSVEGHAEPINGLAFSPDGTFLATGSEDGTIRLWGIA